MNESMIIFFNEITNKADIKEKNLALSFNIYNYKFMIEDMYLLSLSMK